jgi:hypothetical protein
MQKKKIYWSTVLYFVDFKGKKRKKYQHPKAA